MIALNPIVSSAVVERTIHTILKQEVVIRPAGSAYVCKGNIAHAHSCLFYANKFCGQKKVPTFF